MRIDLYWLTAQTNMHVGSGDANYGVIDNLVQRDVLTELPTIHESSLKGALKEYCTHQVKVTHSITDSKIAHKKPEIQQNFGNSDDSGNLRFYGANILTFPVRTSKAMFLHATCPALLIDFKERLSLFGFKDLAAEISKFVEAIQGKLQRSNPIVFEKKHKEPRIEYKDFKVMEQDNISVPSIFTDLVVVHDEDAKLIVGKNKLPVIARNSLTDGKSENLWYEEIVPRQTKFYFFVQDTSIINSQYDWFKSTINGKSVQVGANASIGQGLCKIQKFENNENDA